MDSRAFSEWMVFDAMEPGLDHRVDWLAAQVVGALAGKKGDRLSDYVLRFRPLGKHPGQQSDQQMQQVLMGLAGMMKRKSG